MPAYKKKPLVDIYRLLQAIYGDKCVDVSTLIRWVRRFEQEEVGYAGLCDKTRSGEAPGTEFNNWLKVGKHVLKLEQVMCKSD